MTSRVVVAVRETILRALRCIAKMHDVSKRQTKKQRKKNLERQKKEGKTRKPYYFVKA